ncbi:MAG: hypothetical protein ACR2OU_04690 [Thermomicrobiales bacterium]
MDSATEPGKVLERLRAMHDLGFTVAYITVPGPEPLATVEMFGSNLVPEITEW